MSNNLRKRGEKVKNKILNLLFISLFLVLALSFVSAQTNVSLLYGYNSSSAQFDPVHINTDGSLQTTLNLSQSTGIHPKSDNSYTIGSAGARWLNLFLSGNLYSNGTIFESGSPLSDLYLLNSGDTATGNYTFDTDTFFLDSSSNRIGIGTISPATKLTIQHSDGDGILLATDSTTSGEGGVISFHTTTSGWGSSNAHARIEGRRVDASNGILSFFTRQSGSTDEAMRIDENGNVGIGTTGPGGLLQVATNGLVIDQFNDVSGPNTGFSYIWTTDGGAGGLRASELGHLILQTRSSAGREIIFVTGTTPTERMTIHDTGNVGIGTSFPGYVLEVIGDIFFNLSTTSQHFNIVNLTGDSKLFVNGSSGNVGIGTTVPKYYLDLVGSQAGTEVSGVTQRISNSAGDAALYIISDGSDPVIRLAVVGGANWRVGVDNSASDNFVINNGAIGSSDDFVIDTSGKVLIGNTSSVAAGLLVISSLTGDARLSLDSGGTNRDPLLYFYENGVAKAFVQYDSSLNKFTIYANNGGTAERIRMADGTDDIDGDGNFNDIAFGPSEWVIGQAEEGTLVCLIGAKIDEDGTKRAEIKPCDKADSHFILGVVLPKKDGANHGNPRFEYQDYLLEKYNLTGAQWKDYWKENHVAIELTGFRELKVVGPVKVGDLLVSSDIPGHAKASENPKTGTVIGKAAENFDGNKGKVFARIHLQ